MNEFLAGPSDATLSNLKSIPALYEALRYEYLERGSFGEDTLQVCFWLAKRAGEVIASLVQHKCSPLDERPQMASDWRKVRTYFAHGGWSTDL